MNPFDSCAIDRRCSLHQPARSCVRCSVHFPLPEWARLTLHARHPRQVRRRCLCWTPSSGRRAGCSRRISRSVRCKPYSVWSPSTRATKRHLQPNRSMLSTATAHSAVAIVHRCDYTNAVPCSARGSVPLLCGPQHSTSQPAMARPVGLRYCGALRSVAQYTQQCAALTQRSAAALPTAHSIESTKSCCAALSAAGPRQTGNAPHVTVRKVLQPPHRMQQPPHRMQRVSASVERWRRLDRFGAARQPAGVRGAQRRGDVGDPHRGRSVYRVRSGLAY